MKSLKLLLLSSLAISITSPSSCNTQRNDERIKQEFWELMHNDSDLTIQAIKEGTWGDGIYRISTAQEFYVFRFMNSMRTDEEIQREIELCSLMSQAGVSPKLHEASSTKRILIMDEVMGDNLLDPKLDINKAKNLGLKIRRIQNVSSKYLTALSPNQILNQLITTFQICLPPNYKEVQQRLAADFIHLAETNSRVISHLDLNPGNILLDSNGEVIIIDWEDCVISNQYLDIATLLIFYDFGKKELEAFLEGYGMRWADVDFSQLISAYKFMNFLYAVRLHGISSILPERQGNDQSQSIQALFKLKNWRDLFPQVKNKQTAQTVSLCYLKQSQETPTFLQGLDH